MRNDLERAFVLTYLRLWRGEVNLLGLTHALLDRRNRMSSEPVIGGNGPVVTLTTHGHRIDTVYLTIESIGRGRLKPSRMILWLEPNVVLASLPENLHRLQARGLEISHTQGYGPHTKYYPYIATTSTYEHPVVTADDDVLYYPFWLADLAHAYRAEKDVIHCHRAHVIAVANGAITPYAAWKHCDHSVPDVCNFGTGVSGCIYPPAFLAALKEAGPEFMNTCPKADDIWLHVMAIRSGFKVRQIRSRPLNFPIVPGSQHGRLALDNVGLGYNDQQIRDTYTAHDLQLLAACS